MQRMSKIWGERWLIRKDSTHASSVLFLNPGMECSWHRHQAKHNLFVVLEGKVGVVTGDEERGTTTETILTPGQSFTTVPGEWHKFRVYEKSVMVEEMYVQYEEGDIERRSVGGEFDMNGRYKVVATDLKTLETGIL